jgi:DNA (cytosine-5)-methyltransferase 1
MTTVGSLFSGIGGIDLGLERAGCEVRWQCEADDRCRELLAKRWPGVPCFDDVRTVTDAPAVDVLCGGFPCQDVSVAGRRAGLAGERSGLFHEFARLLDSLAPTWVLIENVPGLLSSGHKPDCLNGECSGCEPGADMGAVLGTLADLGYGWAYRVLDAQYFGVAQRRRRVFIVGCLGDAARAAAVLLESESCEGHPPPSRETGQGVAGTLGSSPAGCGPRTDTDRMTFVPVAASALTAREAKGPDSDVTTPLVAETLRSHPRPGSNSVGQVVAFSMKLHNTASNQAGKFYREYAPSLQHDSPPPAVAFAENQRGEVLETDYARQMTTGGGKPGQGYPAVRQGMAVRRLTPMECERLQGFLDGWTEGFPDSVRYRMLGNAVSQTVSLWLGFRLRAVAEGKDPSHYGADYLRMLPVRRATDVHT